MVAKIEMLRICGTRFHPSRPAIRAPRAEGRRSGRRWWLPVLFVLSILPANSRAEQILTPERVGPELTVSQKTLGYQQAPSVAAFKPGKVVVAWAGMKADFGSPDLIWSTVVDRGARVTSDVRAHRKRWVSGYPAISGFDGDDWIILWTDFYAIDGSEQGILGRRLRTDLRPAGDVFTINSTTEGRQIDPHVATAVTGRHFAVWSDQGNFEKADIRARILESSGAPLGNEIVVAESTGTGTLGARVAAIHDRFLVTWSARDSEGDFEIYFRSYDDNGSAGSLVRANRLTGGNQIYPDVAICADGRFLIVWKSTSARTERNGGIYGQWFDSAGHAVGEQVHVNTYARNEQSYPAVAVTPDCQAVVLWQSYGQDGDQEGIYGRILDPNGVDASDEFRVNGTTIGAQSSSVHREFAFAVDANGSFFAAWTNIDWSSNPNIDPDVLGQWFCWLTNSPDRNCGNATCVGDSSGGGTAEFINLVDALAILRGSVGAAPCNPCRCDIDGSGAVSATDAFAVLRVAVSLPADLSCPVCPS